MKDFVSSSQLVSPEFVPLLACLSFLEWYPCWSHCSRRARLRLSLQVRTLVSSWMAAGWARRVVWRLLSYQSRLDMVFFREAWLLPPTLL